MAPAKRQKQTQRKQEQQISQSLAQDTAKASHRSFDDDDDVSTPAGVDTSKVEPSLKGRDASDNEEDEDDAPIEEMSNKNSRKQASEQASKLKAQEKEARAKRQEVEKTRAEQRKQDETNAVQTETQTKRRGKASTSSDTLESALQSKADTGTKLQLSEQASGSSRLDPSFFAEVFDKPISTRKSILKKRTAEEDADQVAKAQAEKKKRRREQRSGGVILGRDGLPMKRTEDGTTIRALESAVRRKKNTFDVADDGEEDVPLDNVVRPAPLDPTISLPNAKARAYKKRHLEKKGLGQSKAKSMTASKASQKSVDDPLGLNDPAFLPGGEYYHLVNKNNKKSGRDKTAGTPGEIAKQGFRGGGTRKEAISVLRSHSRAGPSLGFARSQM